MSDEDEYDGDLKICRYRDLLMYLAYSVVDQVGWDSSEMDGGGLIRLASLYLTGGMRATRKREI